MQRNNNLSSLNTSIPSMMNADFYTFNPPWSFLIRHISYNVEIPRLKSPHTKQLLVIIARVRVLTGGHVGFVYIICKQDFELRLLNKTNRNFLSDAMTNHNEMTMTGLQCGQEILSLISLLILTPQLKMQ